MSVLNSTIQYQEIPEAPGYRVGSDGTVWSRKNRRWGLLDYWKQMRSPTTRLGYVEVRLRVDGGNKTFSVSRLVAKAFLPNPDGKAEVNHKDGNKRNNAVENLEWVTKSENHRHAYANGLRYRPWGTKAKSAKLTESDIPEIRNLWRSGLTKVAIAKKYGVSESAVGCVIRGITWVHVQDTESD